MEHRFCPAVSVAVIDGHILQVLGDRGDNAIAISQLDDHVTVTGDGSTPSTFTGIDTVRVNTWAGDDSVGITCEFTGSARSTGLNFTCDLGAGNDRFDLAVPGSAETPNSLPAPPANFAVGGGAGNDVLAERIDRVGIASDWSLEIAGGPGDDANTANLLPAVQRGGSFRFRFDGGAGDDASTANILPAVQRGGVFSVTFDGGDGRDVLTGFVEDPNLMPGAVFDATFLGGRGDDVIDVRVDLTGASPEAGRLHVDVNGGPGEDFATASPGIVVTGVEHATIE